MSAWTGSRVSEAPGPSPDRLVYTTRGAVRRASLVLSLRVAVTVMLVLAACGALALALVVADA